MDAYDYKRDAQNSAAATRRGENFHGTKMAQNGTKPTEPIEEGRDRARHFSIHSDPSCD